MIDEPKSKREKQDPYKSNNSTSFRFSKADDLREIMSDLVVGQPSNKDDQAGVTESGGADIKPDGKFINPNPNPTVRVTMKNKGPTSAHKI